MNEKAIRAERVTEMLKTELEMAQTKEVEGTVKLANFQNEMQSLILSHSEHQKKVEEQQMKVTSLEKELNEKETMITNLSTEMAQKEEEQVITIDNTEIENLKKELEDVQNIKVDIEFKYRDLEKNKMDLEHKIQEIELTHTYDYTFIFKFKY